MKEFLIEHSIAIVAAICAMITMFFAILNYFSRNKRSSKIIYQPLEALNIYNSLTNVFKGFDIKYNGEPISSRIIYISGELICKGKDINSLNNQITIKSPTRCKWIDITITNKGNTNASASISKDNEQKAILSFDKLRRNKSLTFRAILQTDINLKKMPVTSIHETIDFEHSIDDTDDVKISTGNVNNHILEILIVLLSVFVTSLIILFPVHYDITPELIYTTIIALLILGTIIIVLYLTNILFESKKH